MSTMHNQIHIKCRSVLICEIIVNLLFIVQNNVLLLRTLRFPEIRACETTDELRWFIHYMDTELWYGNLLERDNTERNNDRVMEGCLK